MISLGTLLLILLVLMALCALWAVMATDLLRSTIALALTSVFLSIAIYMMGSPLAAVFELSVCAGLITVVFISAVSMVKPEGNTRKEDLAIRRHKRLKKYIPLPILLVVAGILLWLNPVSLPITLDADVFPLTVSEVMWDARRVDMIGQALMILVGVFGIVVLFKEFIKRSERQKEEE
ncbi:MAG: NADH-quinone oxidoreductase subunit J [Acidobacteriota bacterium]|jgi:NADH-quinone oxidoreductase subunit J|nr:NADH-quinone oxidoreductase subunit J [Acidobacteriota bacterium]